MSLSELGRRRRAKRWESPTADYDNHCDIDNDAGRGE
jgi:hypothetical protein